MFLANPWNWREKMLQEDVFSLADRKARLEKAFNTNYKMYLSEEGAHPQLAYFYVCISQLSFFDSMIFNGSVKHYKTVRRKTALEFCQGKGLEIGALMNPTFDQDPPSVEMEYCDVISKQDAAQKWKVPLEQLKEVSYICSADHLDQVPDEKYDFLMAHHVLEHFTNPVKALTEWFRVIKPGGRVFISLPNYLGNQYDYRVPPVRKETLEAFASLEFHAKSTGSDLQLKLNDLERLVSSSLSDSNHSAAFEFKKATLKSLVDFVFFGLNLDPSGSPFWAQLEDLIRTDFRPHYHTWSWNSVLDLLTICAASVPFRLVDCCFFTTGYEFVIVLEKTTDLKPFHFDVDQYSVARNLEWFAEKVKAEEESFRNHQPLFAALFQPSDSKGHSPVSSSEFKHFLQAATSRLTWFF